MKKFFRRLGRFCGLRSALLVSLLAGSFYATTASATTLVYCSEASPEGFDPGQATTGTTFDATNLMYDRLIQFKQGGTTIIPALAERWDVSDDNLTYTFHLRKGVKFQSGWGFTPTRDMNADDVVFTFKRGIDKDYYFNKADRTVLPYYGAMGLTDVIKSVEKVDDYTVRFTLKEPQAPFIQNIAMDFAAILSKEYGDYLVSQNRAYDLSNKPIGTGPYRLEKYQKDAVIRFRKNDMYWDAASGHVTLDRIIFSITPSAAARLQKLRRNECQLARYLRPQDLEIVRKDRHVKALSAPGFNVAYLAFNTTAEDINKPSIRRALSLAIDREEIVKVVYQGMGEVANDMMPPTQWGFNPAIRFPTYNPELAKALLKQAGGIHRTLMIYISPAQRPYNPNARLMAEKIQEYWRRIGVKAEIRSYEWAEFIRLTRRLASDVDLQGWYGDNGDPDDWLAVLLGCEAVGHTNNAGWCNANFENLVRVGRRMTSHALRVAAYDEAQKVIQSDVPTLPIATAKDFIFMRNNVSGYVMSPLGRTYFLDVKISS